MSPPNSACTFEPSAWLGSRSWMGSAGGRGTSWDFVGPGELAGLSLARVLFSFPTTGAWLGYPKPPNSTYCSLCSCSQEIPRKLGPGVGFLVLSQQGWRPARAQRSRSSEEETPGPGFLGALASSRRHRISRSRMACLEFLGGVSGQWPGPSR